MPATVRVSDSARLSLRAILIILAAIVLVIPIAVSVVHGAARLNFGKFDLSRELPPSMSTLALSLDSGAAVDIRTTDSPESSVALTGTGPREQKPDLEVSQKADSTAVSVADGDRLENLRLTITVDEETAADLALDLEGGFGTVDVAGDFQEIAAKTDGGTIDISGAAEQVRTATEWGATTLNGSFGTVESKTGVGSLEGVDLSVRDRVEAVTSTGSLDLDFSSDVLPRSGISATTEEGTIELSLPNLELAQDRMAQAAVAAGDEDTADGSEPADAAAKTAAAKGFSYLINAKSTTGTVDLAPDLKQFEDTGGDDGDAALIPVTATAETGLITIEQN